MTTDDYCVNVYIFITCNPTINYINTIYKYSNIVYSIAFNTKSMSCTYHVYVTYNVFNQNKVFYYYYY